MTFKDLRQWQGHSYVALVLRLYVGGVFIYASMYKINYAGEFAETVAAYQLIPYWAVNLVAVILPWIELFSGLLLVAGVRLRSASVAIGLLLTVFIVAIGINLIRETPINCGCFHTIDEPMTWKTLVRDLVWLSMVTHVYFFDSLLHLEKRFFRGLAKDVTV